AFAAKITVSQYGRLVATLPWAVALEKGMFKQAGLDIDGVTAGAGGDGAMTEHALAMLVKPELFLDLIPMRDPHGVPPDSRWPVGGNLAGGGKPNVQGWHTQRAINALSAGGEACGSTP
ncbi:MAG TPA: hypothetical protein VE200_07765, partial [Xanthobacteraceae bacterium]|nr:hypothetical protein [Xanthobacteraceae bacterium]